MWWVLCPKSLSPSLPSPRAGDAAARLRDLGWRRGRGARQSRSPPGGGASVQARPGSAWLWRLGSCSPGSSGPHLEKHSFWALPVGAGGKGRGAGEWRGCSRECGRSLAPRFGLLLSGDSQHGPEVRRPSGRAPQSPGVPAPAPVPPPSAEGKPGPGSLGRVLSGTAAASLFVDSAASDVTSRPPRALPS